MRKTLSMLATLAFLVTLPDFIPYYKDYRMFDWSTLVRLFDFAPKAAPESPDEEPEQQLKRGSIHPLQVPDKSLDPFFTALRRAEARSEEGVVKILHYGDSPTTADLITADIRQSFQSQFGDAGHGYHLIAKPWAWYEHRGVDVQAEGWTSEPANQPDRADGLFGIGGVSFIGGAGAVARFTFRQEGQAMAEVHALRQPGGGRVGVWAGGQRLGELDTAGARPEEAFVNFSLPEKTRRVELRVTSGTVRLFGVLFAKPQPGVMYSSLGVNGAHIGMLATRFREDHWGRMLQHVKPDLVVLNYGTNESTSDAFVDNAYEKTLREAIRRVRKAVPKSALLIMSPMDRGQREMNGSIGTVPALARVVKIQQKVAAETKVAFFNTFEAMGGPGTMGRWYLAEPRLVGADLIHPMPGGAKRVGDLFYKSVYDAYNRHKTQELRRKFQKSPVKSEIMNGVGTGTSSPVPLPRAQ